MVENDQEKLIKCKKNLDLSFFIRFIKIYCSKKKKTNHKFSISFSLYIIRFHVIGVLQRRKLMQHRKKTIEKKMNQHENFFPSGTRLNTWVNPDYKNFTTLTTIYIVASRHTTTKHVTRLNFPLGIFSNTNHTTHPQCLPSIFCFSH